MENLMPPRNATDRGCQTALTSLIFPTYHPAGAVLEATCRAVERFLADAADPWEILFVCDGCTDGTPARLMAWARRFGDRVRVLAYGPNRGKGHAVRAGLAAARGEYRVFTDVDLAYSLDAVAQVAAVLRGGAAVAIASRTHPDSRALVPPHLHGYAYRRHLQSQAFSALVRRLLPITQRDTQAGLKGLSARAARLLLPRLHCDGFAFDCELLTACARLGLAVTEVPVQVRYDTTQTTTNLRSTLRMLRSLWGIRRAWRGVAPAAAAAVAVQEPQAA
jgi:hypothetical protein